MKSGKMFQRSCLFLAISIAFLVKATIGVDTEDALSLAHRLELFRGAAERCVNVQAVPAVAKSAEEASAVDETLRETLKMCGFVIRTKVFEHSVLEALRNDLVQTSPLVYLDEMDYRRGTVHFETTENAKLREMA